jgi:hypothetical protein
MYHWQIHLGFQRHRSAENPNTMPWWSIGVDITYVRQAL